MSRPFQATDCSKEYYSMLPVTNCSDIMRHLLKADVGSPLTKALAANVQTVLADDTVSVAANAAVAKVKLC